MSSFIEEHVAKALCYLQLCSIRPYPETAITCGCVVDGEVSGRHTEEMPRTKPWTVSDEFWERVEPLVPEAPSHARGGRPRMPDRKAFEAMVYVLRTGIQWNALPREMGASSTVHERFQEWEREGFFEEGVASGAREVRGVGGHRVGVAIGGWGDDEGPLGRGASGPNPTDWAKKGVK